jgi:NADH dehydrogenase FAD-containing subunit
VTPYFQVFLQAYVSDDVEKTNVEAVPKAVLAEVEADSFWCLTKLLDGIQVSGPVWLAGLEGKDCY